MNRMSHFRPNRTTQQQMQRVKQQQAVFHQAERIDARRLAEKIAKPSTEPEQ